MTGLIGVAVADRPWNGWTITHHGEKWHRVEFDSRTSTATLVCTGRAVTTGGMDVLDYRWNPDSFMRCHRCAPPGWVLVEPPMWKPINRRAEPATPASTGGES